MSKDNNAKELIHELYNYLIKRSNTSTSLLDITDVFYYKFILKLKP